MAGSEFVLEVGELKALSEAMVRAATLDVEKLMGEMGVTEEGEIKERFDSKKDPDGKKWGKWSSRYAAEQSERNRGASILAGSGALKESIGFQLSPDGVTWGSTLPYARIHQKGGKAGRGRKVKIPARPYLGIGEAGGELLVETVEDFIRRESGGLL